MAVKSVSNNDLVTLEFLKEARILKRQMKLLKGNMDQISVESLIKISAIIKVISQEMDGFIGESEVILSEVRKRSK